MYRVVAAVDAWQVARFLNAADAAGDGRLGRAKLPINPISAAGLLAVVLVIGAGHIAVARYNVLALDLVNCVFNDSGDASCDDPGDTPEPTDSGSPGDSPEPTDAGADRLADRRPCRRPTRAPPAPSPPPCRRGTARSA